LIGPDIANLADFICVSPNLLSKSQRADAGEQHGHDRHDRERGQIFEEAGAAQNGKMKPEKKTLGMMNVIDICKACIWFSALVATSRPRRRSAKTLRCHSE